jgi:hypothetical protein
MILALHKNKRPNHGGSIFGRDRLWRARLDGQNWLTLNYFADSPAYPERFLRHRPQLETDLLKHIVESVKLHGIFFEHGHSTYLKVTATLRMMAYGISANLVDGNLAMGESQAINYVKRSVVAMIEVFGPEYLRAPNAQDMAKLLAIRKSRGFPCALGSIDCMDNPKDMKITPLFLKPWLIRRRGFHMLFWDAR